MKVIPRRNHDFCSTPSLVHAFLPLSSHLSPCALKGAFLYCQLAKFSWQVSLSALRPLAPPPRSCCVSPHRAVFLSVLLRCWSFERPAQSPSPPFPARHRAGFQQQKGLAGLCAYASPPAAGFSGFLAWLSAPGSQRRCPAL